MIVYFVKRQLIVIHFHHFLDSINLNTPVVALNTAPNFMDSHQKHVIEDMQDAIAIATGELNLLPGVAFQARVAQLSQLNAAHQTVSN